MQADGVYKRGGATGYPEYPVPMPVNAEPRQPSMATLFPPRFGTPSSVPTIMDVISMNRLYRDARGATSGYGGPGYSGTARPATSWF